MSATGRSDVRRPDDAYMTPPWCVRRLLEVWLPRPRSILVEPAVGSGNIVRTVNEVAHPECDWLTWDVREVAPVGSHIRGNFLESRCCDDRVSAVITNPPYNLAEEFVRMSRSLFPRAELAFLLRLNFLGSSKRIPLWSHVGQPSVYVLPNRPSFTDGGTDATEYAWFVWRGNGKHVIEVLKETRASERKSLVPSPSVAPTQAATSRLVGADAREAGAMTNLDHFMETQTESLRNQLTDAHETAKNLAAMARNVEDKLAAGALCRCYGQVLANLAKALEMVP